VVNNLKNKTSKVQKQNQKNVEKTKEEKQKMKKTILTFLTSAIALALAMSASAQGLGAYSGTALQGLSYPQNWLNTQPDGSGTWYLAPATDSQYVPPNPVTGAPALAALSTADAGTSYSADDPAVFVQGPLTLLSSFSASYDLYSSSGEAGFGVGQNPPYWIIWLADDPTYSSPIVADGGPTLNGSSLVHVGDLINGSLTLSALDTDIDPRTGLPYGQSTVAWAGVEIGNWDNGTLTIPADAEFDSITIVPEPGTLALVATGLVGILFVIRRRQA
jgi:hypothetical protein